MRHSKKSNFMLVLWVLLQFVSIGPLNAQIIVNNETEIPADLVAFRENLVGLRTVSPEFFAVVQLRPKNAGIPAELFVTSASATPAVRMVVTEAGKDPEKASVIDWYKAARTAGLGDISSGAAPHSISATAWKGKHVNVNPVFVASLPDTEVFAAKPVLYTEHAHGHDIAYLRVNRRPLAALIQSYKSIGGAKKTLDPQALKQFAEAIAGMAPFPLMAKAATFSAGLATFGRPIVYTAGEKKLVMPKAILTESDIYWIELAVSFRDIEVGSVERLIFHVSLPSGITALDLIPLRFDKQATVTQKVSSPEIKVQAGENAVGIGKVYEQEVVYTSLKPLIVAAGLQESEFTWSLSDEAVQPGAKRFVAVIQVPKGRKSVPVQLQATAKTKEWFAQGDLVSTPSKLIEIPLR